MLTDCGYVTHTLVHCLGSVENAAFIIVSSNCSISQHKMLFTDYSRVRTVSNINITAPEILEI